ncbi:MAG: sensor histidine kinase, partial [Ruminococcus sp.]|nr:sensor histidine kinase [Ruminococcus sp.]
EGKNIWSFENSTKAENVLALEFTYYEYDYEIKMSVYDEPIIDDSYMLANNIINLLYAMLYWIYAVGIFAFISTVALTIFLLCSSGHRKGNDEVTAGWGTKMPFDIVTGVAAAFVACVLNFFFGGNYYLTEITHIIPLLAIAGVTTVSIFFGWLMSFALRIKLGKWWKNTVIYRVLAFIWKIARFAGRNLVVFFRNVPLVWKAVLVVAGVSFAGLVLMINTWCDYGSLMFLWFCSSLVLGCAVLYCAIAFKKLRQSGESLANGDLGHQLDTSKLIGDFKMHGESLNSIAKGMTIAVEERMKSERMKTELITNVSHDIKTPLTSIINYTDLICKEKCDNEKISEYSEVLSRQSERLKRLIEDLVEASKASTGNLEVNLAPCEVNILLTQASGEYEERLKSRNLELVINQPSTPVIIMADGRRLWRVVDNLMNNICKYAQSATRVYLTLEKTADEAVITFKNVSNSPLNISADELMERFVRGDSSRNTEGNGLGLSIAKSLTQLQNGNMEIFIDGDLFKVILRFPIIK